MKNTLSPLLLIVLVSIGFQLAPGCVGVPDKIQEVALFEPAQLAWSAVESDARIGIADAESEGVITGDQAAGLVFDLVELETALGESNRTQIRMSAWPQLKTYAERGIAVQLAEGKIGPGVAESFREHLANFDTIIKAIRGTQ